jgi:integrase
MREICKNAKLPKGFRPLHGLRHVYASMLASSGKVDLYTLQRLLTHKSPVMTMRYAHLRDEALKAGADQVDEIFKKQAESKKEAANG